MICTMFDYLCRSHRDKQNMKNKALRCNVRVDRRSYLSTIAGLCARGVRKEFGKLRRTISLVKLQGNWGCCCSPLMKSSSLSHNMTDSMEVFCIPCPCDAWLVHTKSSIANAPGGGFWTLSLSEIRRSTCVARNVAGGIRGRSSSFARMDWDWGIMRRN